MLTNPTSLARLIRRGKVPPVVEQDGTLVSGYNRRALKRLLRLQP